MKHKGHKQVTLESLNDIKDTMANYIVYHSYTFAPKAIGFTKVHVGFGSQNHAETIQRILGNVGQVKIVEVWADCREMKDFGIGTQNSKQDLQ